MTTVIKLATPDETIIAKNRILRRGTAWIIQVRPEFTRTRTFSFYAGYMMQYYLRRKTGKIVYLKTNYSLSELGEEVVKEANRLSTLGWDRIFYIQVPTSGRWTVSTNSGYGTVPISVQKEPGLVGWVSSVIT